MVEMFRSMKPMKRTVPSLCAVCVAASLLAGCAKDTNTEQTSIYRYPLVTMDMTRKQQATFSR